MAAVCNFLLSNNNGGGRDQRSPERYHRPFTIPALVNVDFPFLRHLVVPTDLFNLPYCYLRLSTKGQRGSEKLTPAFMTSHSHLGARPKRFLEAEPLSLALLSSLFWKSRKQSSG